MAEFPKRSQHPWDDQLKAYIDHGDAAKPEVDLSGVQQSLTGTGSPLGVVTPPRAGIIYIDKAMTNGARQWISTGTNNTSWVVTDGDTGWRDLRSYLVNGATPIGAEPVMVRRVGAMVTMHLAISWPTPWDPGTPVMVAPLGGFMRPVGTGFMPPSYDASLMTAYGRTDGSTFSLEVDAYSNEARWTWTWMTDDPWPTTLPGSPAVRFWQTLAIIPQVSQETSYTARNIQSLTPYEGRLYVGYGDYGDNTGPCDIISVGADGSIQTHLSGVPTESVETIRVFDGALFIPSIDPSWYFGPGGLTTNHGGTWRTIEIRPDMVHTFDFAMTSDGAWWVCGSSLSDTDSQVGHASVLRSTDEGATWTKVRRSSSEGTFVRYYWIRTDGTYVYVDDRSADGAETYYRSSDGTSWEAVSTAPADPLDTLDPALSTAPMPQGATSRSVAQLDGVWYCGGEEGRVYRFVPPQG